MDEGYRLHVANPSRVQQYLRLKHGDDEDDAFWLAEMLRLNILPRGYIYMSIGQCIARHQCLPNV